MRSTRTVELSTGLFVLLGFAALFFMVTQITNRELSVNGGSYEVTAMFENIGSLRPGAAVSMAGVTVGRVDTITFDQNVYKAVVKMRIASNYNRIPNDSDAAIMTSGLLGGQYVGITAGGSEEYLKSGDRIELVQDALVLENLINQLVASFMGRRDEQNDSGAETSDDNQSGEGAQSKTEEAKQ
ncbi:outer membrane lipid asymmetry maintenance protein MlaD [Steroidobacter sp. S1-65]|uniref:Outer membrane lipid asymmetry maintenance protein MlaD n=1 Tax=Steroidobacter gossypii TaxID=2805490 RepID=A0ABS1X1J0_9GAMM|nr:outer membrane lipid asymmetry maintenance protein MlaD [Steroidobacter gossypii]MBM0107073.1 outer membrane lipid asymmetry maintenance protein MlaD [Steroidobacter gossypii]